MCVLTKLMFLRSYPNRQPNSVDFNKYFTTRKEKAQSVFPQTSEIESFAVIVEGS